MNFNSYTPLCNKRLSENFFREPFVYCLKAQLYKNLFFISYGKRAFVSLFFVPPRRRKII